MLGATTAPMEPVHRVTTDQILAIADVDPSVPTAARPTATGSQPVEVLQTPTVALAPVELEAIVQGATSAPGLARRADTQPTVESLRLAIGTTAMMPPTIAPPPAAASPPPAAARPPTGAVPTSGRGPRRARETLRADKIRSGTQTAFPPPPTRKR